MSSWQPVLAGADADAARDAVDAILSDLGAVELPDASVGHGHAGLALMWGQRARAGDPAALERAADALERALDGIDRLGPPTLLGGFPGVAFAAAQLSDLVEIDEEDLTALDELVLGLVDRDPWPLEWEYVSGLVGAAVPLLWRGSEPARVARARVVAHLRALSEPAAGGVSWRSPVYLLPAAARAENPDGYLNLGLAHGVTGVVALLAGAAGEPGAAELLRGAVGALVRHDSGDPSGRYAAMVARGLPPARGRYDGWCYGDQAVACALHRAGAALGEPGWIEHAVDLGRAVARRAPGIPLESHFCHGTAGRAHMFNRLGQATGEAELLETARTWYRETLSRRRSGAGPGGFVTRAGAPVSPSILEGAIGIALCLSAAVDPVEPIWDRAFLADLVPGAVGGGTPHSI